MNVLLLLSTLATSSAFAGEESSSSAAPATVVAPAVADDDDDFFNDKKPAADKGANAGVPDKKSFSDDDDIAIPATPPPEAKVEAKVTLKADSERDLGAADLTSGSSMPVTVAGAKALSDNWAPSVVIKDKDAVVVEMPVLYATSKKDFDGVSYWLVAEVYADGKKVAESRVNVTRDAIADKGPSVQFFRMFAPVSAATGMLEVRVSKAATGGKPEPLFTRSVKYTL